MPAALGVCWIWGVRRGYALMGIGLVPRAPLLPTGGARVGDCLQRATGRVEEQSCDSPARP
jgi:hypothetical protein